MLTKHTLCYINFLKIKTYLKKLKLRLNWILTKRDWKQMNIFERKVYKRILGPLYINEKENFRLLTNKEIYEIVKNPIITGTVRLNRLQLFWHVQRMEENRILYMNLETTRLRSRPRNRWQNEVREDGRIVGAEGCRKKYITERNGRSS
jgi:hypothetical protein